ncbi:MAG: RloB family protein [Kiritimatiellae bacterium]|nr:RloB family protein [Kiritimatiellia bacterium]
MSGVLSRNAGVRRYKRVFLISCEGSVTEPEYFDFFQRHAIIKCLRAKGKSAPQAVLERMNKEFDRTPFRKGDEAWLVVDKDDWNDSQLVELHRWTEEHSVVKRGLAVSNPRFELWLLLHFEEVAHPCPGHKCTNRLEKHLTNYKKHLACGAFPRESVDSAIARAKKLDQPAALDWPRKTGTTVYRLAEDLLRKA